MTSATDDNIIHRCYDDVCGQRRTCRCYVLRHQAPPGSRVAFTWREGNEVLFEKCKRHIAVIVDTHLEDEE